MDNVTDDEAHAWLLARNFERGFMGARKLSRLSTSHAERPHPLLVAAEAGDLKICQWLFDHGADRYVSVPSNHNWTPMMRAASRGHAHVCEWLISHGASHLDIERPGSTGYTCMHWASRAGSLPTCRMLYRHPGGERTVRQSNDAGWRPLRIASQHDQISTCLWLIAHGAADWSDNWCSNAEKASVRSVGRYAGKNECVSLEIVSVDLPDGALGSGPSLPRSSPRGVNGEGPLPSTTTTRQRRVNSSQSGRKSVRARVVGAAREFLELHSVFVQGFVLGAGARNFSDGSSKGIYSGNANNHDIISRRVALRAEVSALSGPMHLVASFLFEYGWPLGPCLTRIRSLVRVVSAIDAQESTTSNMSESAAAATHAAMQRSNTATTESSDTLAMASDSGVGSSSPASNIAETHAASSPRAALEVAPGATATVSLHKTEEEEVTSSSSISLHSSQLEGGSAIATTKSRTGRSSGSTEPLRGDSSGSSRNWHTSDAVPAWLTGWNSTTTAVLATVAVAVSIAALLSADQQRKRQHF